MAALPKDVLLLSPRTREYVTVCSKRDFTGVIKGKAFEMRREYLITQVDLI